MIFRVSTRCHVLLNVITKRERERKFAKKMYKKLETITIESNTILETWKRNTSFLSFLRSSKIPSIRLAKIQDSKRGRYREYRHENRVLLFLRAAIRIPLFSPFSRRFPMQRTKMSNQPTFRKREREKSRENGEKWAAVIDTSVRLPGEYISIVHIPLLFDVVLKKKEREKKEEKKHKKKNNKKKRKKKKTVPKMKRHEVSLAAGWRPAK